MIGSTLITRRSFLKRKLGARRDQREGEPESRGADADEQAEEQRVPGNAAAQVARQAVETPDRLVEEFRRRTRAGAKLPLLSAKALARIVETGKKTKTTISAMTMPMDETTKASPRHQPRAARPWQRTIRNAVAVSAAP